MNRIGRRFSGLLIALIGGAAVSLAPAGAVLASHVHPRAAIPTDMVAGVVSRIPVTLLDGNGAALQGTEVIFFLHATFAGVEGEAEVGTAVTDSNGTATIDYRPRQVGQHRLRIEYASPAGGEVEVFDAVFEVTDGGQLYRSPATAEIPGVGGGLVMAVLTIVWTILFSVALRLVAIARAGRSAQASRAGKTG